MTDGNFSAMRRLLLFAKPAGATTSIVAATISLATFLSLAHEIAFYSVINFGFLALLAATDYVKQSIYWAPFTVFGLIIGNVIGEKSNKKFRTRKAMAIDQVDHESLMSLGFKSRLEFLLLTIFLIASLAILSILFPWPILFFTVPLMTLIVGLSISRNKFQDLPHDIMRYALPLVATLMISAIWGYCEAPIRTSSNIKHDAAKVFTRLAPAGDEIIILRYIDKGIVGMRASDSRAVFLPWSDVARVETTIQVSRSILDFVKASPTDAPPERR